MVLKVRLWNAEKSSVDMGRGGCVVVGRDSSQSDLCLLDPAVSHRHCKLSISGSLAWLEDLGSSNGTYVNGERVGSVPLCAGDVIKVGRCRIDVS